MSRIGTFAFAINTGIEDQLLTNVNLLSERIEEIRRTKGKSYSPSLNYIEETHTIFVNKSYKPCAPIAFEYMKMQTKGVVNFGTEIEFDMQRTADFYADSVVHIQLTGLKAVSPVDKVRYVAMLGHRIMKKVTLSLDNNVIDEISTENYNIHYNFKVPSNKREGWLRCIGQEIPVIGTLTPDPLTDEFKEQILISDGNQTFKREHATVDLFIPVIMFFADVHNAIPMCMLNQGQNRLKLLLPDVSEIVSYADYGGGGKFTPPKIKICDLYMNTITVLPQISEIVQKNYGFTMIRVHKGLNKIVKTSKESILLDYLKYPIETMYVGFRPISNYNNSQLWFKNTFLTRKTIPTPVITGGVVLSTNDIVYYDESEPVTGIQLKLNTVPVYPEISPEFFSSYFPYRYGDFYPTPKDQGWYMLNFNLTPGNYNPGGYFNAMKAREIYLDYISSNISEASPCYLLIAADCINFLYIDNKTKRPTLRFT